MVRQSQPGVIQYFLHPSSSITVLHYHAGYQAPAVLSQPGTLREHQYSLLCLHDVLEGVDADHHHEDEDTAALGLRLWSLP